jgi:hypothetical protein
MRKRVKFYHVPSDNTAPSRVRHTSFTTNSGKISVRNSFVDVLNAASSAATLGNDGPLTGFTDLHSDAFDSGTPSVVDLNTLSDPRSTQRHPPVSVHHPFHFYHSTIYRTNNSFYGRASAIDILPR